MQTNIFIHVNRLYKLQKLNPNLIHLFTKHPVSSNLALITFKFLPRFEKTKKNNNLLVW